MLKDITIGQYFPGASVLHKLDPRVKIVLTIAYIVMLFAASNAVGLAVGVLFLIVVYAVSKIPPSMILKSLKPVVPIIIFTSLLNMLFIDGRVLVSFWILKITAEGIQTAVFMSVRIICLIAGTSLLTYTSSPIALRFIPTLIEETDKIMSAQKARGADLESGGLMQRARALIPILIPLFVSAFRRADELALAMECRCYRGGEGRTRMKQLKIHGRDIWCSAVVVACFACVIAANFTPWQMLLSTAGL